MKLSVEDSNLIHNFIILPYVKKVLEMDLKTISSRELFKIRAPYTLLVEGALSEISIRLQIIKKQMYSSGIKVFENGQNGMFIKFEWKCRGYEGEKQYTTHAIKMHVETIMNELFNL